MPAASERSISIIRTEQVHDRSHNAGGSGQVHLNYPHGAGIQPFFYDGLIKKTLVLLKPYGISKA
jgi:hypothetical protein